MAPEKAFAHAEIGRELVVDAELDDSSVQDPSLVACRIACYVERITRPIRVVHQSRYSSRHRAECGSGRDDVCFPSDRQSRRRVKAKAVANRPTARPRPRGARVKDLSL